jgi:hypothetical protein
MCAVLDRIDAECDDGIGELAFSAAMMMSQGHISINLDDSVEWCLFRTVALVDISVGAAGLWQSS